ncbi:general stress protein [Lentibacillus sp. N15]|uniref:general stress protein n=1 Tax=Lentibacillus songyuanensis TaxID=3136161 RepID=UPI0031BA1C54
MAYEIYGPFYTEKDVIKTVDVLGLKGFKSDNIFVFANEQMTGNLMNRIDAQIGNNAISDHNKHPLINKMKNIFSRKLNLTTDMEEKLISLGVTTRQVDRYTSDIASGSILIIVYNQKRWGNDVTETTSVLKVPIIKRG